MTPGATAETVDAMSLEKIDTVIDALRHERYRWTPVRRTYIPKKLGKRRPLGLPKCELCGATASCEVHHIRKLADLNKPGQTEKPLWVKRMAARHRKTRVTCRKCHEEIHRERSSRRNVTV